MALALPAGSRNTLLMIPSAAGLSPAAPAPWTARNAISHARLGAMLHSQEPRMNRDNPAWNTVRRPNRSAITPADISRLARVTV